MSSKSLISNRVEIEPGYYLVRGKPKTGGSREGFSMSMVMRRPDDIFIALFSLMVVSPIFLRLFDKYFLFALVALALLVVLIVFINVILGDMPGFKADKTKETVFWYSGSQVKEKLIFREIKSVSLDMKRSVARINSRESIAVSEYVLIDWFVDLIDSENRVHSVFSSKNEIEARNVARSLAKFLNRPIFDKILEKTVNADEVAMNLKEKLKLQKYKIEYPDESSIRGFRMERSGRSSKVIIEPANWSIFENGSFLKIVIQSIVMLLIFGFFLVSYLSAFFSPGFVLLSGSGFLILLVLTIKTYLRENNPKTEFILSPRQLTVLDRKGVKVFRYDLPLESLDNIKFDCEKEPRLEFYSGNSILGFCSYLDTDSLRYLERVLKNIVYELPEQSSDDPDESDDPEGIPREEFQV